jgi:hypothetical protein
MITILTATAVLGNIGIVCAMYRCFKKSCEPQGPIIEIHG